MADCKYKFSPETPSHIINVVDEKTRLLIPTKVVGVTPFGKQTGVITEDKLTNSIAEFLLGKPEWAKFIVSKDKKDK